MSDSIFIHNVIATPGVFYPILAVKFVFLRLGKSRVLIGYKFKQVRRLTLGFITPERNTTLPADHREQGLDVLDLLFAGIVM